jgi:ATP-dependent Clp protease adapter protein ClpS
MSILLLLRLLVVLLLLAVIAWFSWRMWHDRGGRQRTPRDQAAAERARAIVANGGPTTLAQHLAIFSDACPQCGGRTWAERLIESYNTAGQVPALTSAPEPLRVRRCPRCGYGNDLQPEDNLPRVLRQVTSPYLDEAVASRIAEPPYHGPEVALAAAFPAEPQIIGSAPTGAAAAAERWNVMLENDDITPMDEVVEALSTAFDLPVAQAVALMLQAHQQQQCLVATLPYSEAYQRAARAIQHARAQGYPLTFVLVADQDQ